MSMTSATDELRRMLDERGVEWTYEDGVVSYASDGHWRRAWAHSDNAMCVSMGYLTPEQAIAATLGMGTCHDSNKRFNAWQCSECGATLMLMFDDFGEPTYSVDGVADVPRYCPNCGRKVVDE